MIYSLGEPVYFAGLVVGFVLGCVAHAGVQRWAIARFGGPAARWLLPPRQGIGRFVDPYGAVGALLGAVGWATPVESGSYHRTGRARTIALILTGAVANVAVSVVCLAALARLGGLGNLLGSPSVGDLLRGHLGLSSTGPTLLSAIALVNMAMAVLSLIPLPPLDGGRILFLLAPRTIGWQKAEYYLVDRNIGVAIVLLGLVLSFGARPAPIAYVVETIAIPAFQALLRAFGG